MQKEVPDIDTEIKKSDFKTFFYKKIYPHTHKYEKQRNVYLFLTMLIPMVFLTIAVIAIIVFPNIIKDFETDARWLFGVFYVCIFCITPPALIIKHYKNIVKKELLPKLLEYVGFKVKKNTHAAENFITNYIRRLIITPRFSNIWLDDLITGEYKGLYLTISEFRLSVSGGTGSSTIFDGLFVVFPNIKEQKAVTIITDSRIGDYTVIDSSLERIKLEDPEFESFYSVYSTDQILGRNILTPAFMSRMIELYTHHNLNAKGITISFEQNNINIQLHHQLQRFKMYKLPEGKANPIYDWFEVSITKKADDIKNYSKIIKQIETIFFIIDTLKLSK